MNRAHFIKSILAVGGAAILPVNLTAKTEYNKVLLHQFFIRGFQYYKGPILVHQLQRYGMIDLVREPENKYDKFAIALHYQRHKLGYVPMEDNLILAQLLDANLLDLQAEIVSILPNNSDWEKIEVQLFALQEKKENSEFVPMIPKETQSFCWSDRNDTLFKYHLDTLDDNFSTISSDHLYSALIINETISKELNTYFKHQTDFTEALEQGRFVINTKCLSIETIANWCDTLENNLLSLETVLGEKGIVVAKVDQMKRFPEKIERIVKKSHNHSIDFFEIFVKT